MDVKVFVTVIPEEGELSRIAKELLAVADHPYDVQMVSHPDKSFRVPQELFDRFEAARQDRSATAGENQEAQVPQPRRRGRPRKNPMPEQKVEDQ